MRRRWKIQRRRNLHFHITFDHAQKLIQIDEQNYIKPSKTRIKSYVTKSYATKKEVTATFSL